MRASVTQLREARAKFPPLFAVYRSPRDFPQQWVVRVWWGFTPEPIACVCDTLQEARESVPHGSILLPRQDGDDPVLFETWI